MIQLYTLCIQFMHASFTNDQSKMMLNLFKPNIHSMDDTVHINDQSIHRYVKARLYLENKDTFAIASLEEQDDYEPSKINMFLCRKYMNKHIIDCCLWSDNAQKAHVFKELKLWHSETFDYCKLRIGSTDTESKQTWFENEK